MGGFPAFRAVPLKKTFFWGGGNLYCVFVYWCWPCFCLSSVWEFVFVASILDVLRICLCMFQLILLFSLAMLPLSFC